MGHSERCPFVGPGLFLGQPCRVWCESGEGEKYFHYWRCLLLHHAWELPFGKTNWIGGCCQFSWSSGWEVPWLLHVCVQQVTFFCGGHVDSCVPVPSHLSTYGKPTYKLSEHTYQQGISNIKVPFHLISCDTCMIMHVSICIILRISSYFIFRFKTWIDTWYDMCSLCR